MNRLAELQSRLPGSGVDLVAVAPGANMRYLLRFAPLADERPCVLLVSHAAVCFVVPVLNAEQTRTATGMELITWSDAEGPEGALQQAVRALPVNPSLAVDNTMRADTLLPLYAALGPRHMQLATDIIGAMRVSKSAEELTALQCAAAQADRAMTAGVAACRPGVTELEVARAVEAAFLADGADQVEFAIVASGPNGAFPHHHPGQCRLQPGDTVIIDIGASLDGYKSDITRVVHLGQPPDEVRQVYAAVLEALRRAEAAVRPGVLARDVDRAARTFLEDCGYGAFFVHRTGHGLGLEGHEPPWITSDSDTRLEPGMVFSIEPGVYLPGRFGVRIEDIVAVTPDGARVLTGFAHDLSVR